MTHSSKQDPLHGITLEKIVTQLEEKYGWEALGQRIKIKCFTHDPSLSSSLKFLRKTPWARKKVEVLYQRTNWANEKINSGPENSVWLTAKKNKKSQN